MYDKFRENGKHSFSGKLSRFLKINSKKVQLRIISIKINYGCCKNNEITRFFQVIIRTILQTVYIYVLLEMAT